jgi:hypothetical protein
MTPHFALRSGLTALLLSVLILIPRQSAQTVILVTKDTGDMLSLKPASLSSSVPPQQNKLPQNDKKPDGKEAQPAKSKHHSDEEKHKNHLYDYTWIRHKKQRVARIMQVFVKIFIAFCFYSVLLCTYMHLAH